MGGENFKGRTESLDVSIDGLENAVTEKYKLAGYISSILSEFEKTQEGNISNNEFYKRVLGLKDTYFGDINSLTKRLANSYDK